jgi:hypothetical protein
MSIKKHDIAYSIIIDDDSSISYFKLAVTNDSVNTANVSLSGADLVDDVAENLVLHSPEIASIMVKLADAIKLKQT